MTTSADDDPRDSVMPVRATACGHVGIGSGRDDDRGSRLEEHEADLVVVGGGMSGLCAAIAAARHGAEVIIVQERPVFGGSGSSEIRVPVSGAASSNAWSAEGGLIHEIMLEDRATSPNGPRPTDTHLDLILDDLLQRTEHLRVFRSTVVDQLELADVPPADHAAPPHARPPITAVVGTQLGSERRLRFRARQFVDATGDATIATYAGARTRYGREARAEYGESLAPVHADASSLGSTITMQARRTDRPVPFHAPDWAVDYSGTALTFDRTTPKVDGDVLSGFWWIEVNDPFHQIHDSQDIRHQLHRHVLGLWDFLKNRSDRREELEDFHLEWIGQVPGKRESRRVVGDVTLTQDDVTGPTRWPDEVGTAGWWIDLHTTGGVTNFEAPAERENVDRFYRGLARVAPFSIPLRACYSADVPNLWVTGRCISATHVGLGPARVQQSLGQLGQSVGTAAAQALHAGCTPRALAQDPRALAILQQQILRDGVRLLHTSDTDPADLALQARAEGAARSLDMPTEPARWTPICNGLAQVIPELGTNEDRSIWFLLRNPTATDGEVEVRVETLTAIWDRPTTDGAVLGRLRIAAGAEQWLSVRWQDPPTGTPVRIALHPEDGPGSPLEWAAATGPAPTGTLAESLIIAPGGPEEQHRELKAFAPEEIEIPAYRLWRQHRRTTQLLRLDPPARPYEADRVNNGRAWPGRGANLWISPPELPAAITLSWPRPFEIGQVQISLDTDLDTSTDRRPGLHRAPECVRDLDVQVRTGEEWETVARLRDNHHRRRVLTFPPTCTDALRVVVTATHGDPSARIYEIRAYADTGPGRSRGLDQHDPCKNPMTHEGV